MNYKKFQLAINTFDTRIIIPSGEGNLRLCNHLCYSSLIKTCQEKKTVTITHINNILIQPHWRSHKG